MSFLRVTGLLSLIVALTSGCAMHNVTFVPRGAVKAPPTTYATAIQGAIDEARQCWEQAQLPHNTPRQRYELECKAGRSLRSQLGSEDYILLGEVYGGGSAYSNLESLKAAFCKKAAVAGGDVVLMFRTGIENRPYVYSRTFNNNDELIYAGVMHFPYANGLVFRHVPGADERRRRIAALSDSQLASVLDKLQVLDKTSTLTWDEYLVQADEVVESAALSANRR
ncbi:MAG: hypothetical protein L0Y42_02185 [Phycisphaerales bacterium]|nr:hypothetical protein [Phycisphaerales bacterium]